MSNGDSRRRLRLNLTVTSAMAFALEDLAERSGTPPTTQATILLRQALDRTIQTERVQERLRKHNANRNLQTSQLERTTEHAIETTYAKAQEAEHAAELARARAANAIQQEKHGGSTSWTHDSIPAEEARKPATGRD